MKILNKWPLLDGFSIAEVDLLPEEFLKTNAKKYLGPEYPMLPNTFGVDKKTTEKLKEIRQLLNQKFELRLALLKGKELIGWSYGWQDSIEKDTFFMGVSLVLPEHQRKGLYSSLLKKVLEITKEAGFQSVTSLHIMTNNPVLIAKMKLGFHIYGFEVNTRYGAMVRLIYHHNKLKQNALEFRAGAINNEETLKELKK